MKDFTIAGVVTLYHPDADVVGNIETYINSLDHLFLVNNGAGETAIQQLKQKYNTVEVINEQENMGIAYPLNQALALCKGKYDFLMTMDQDSAFCQDDVKRYVNKIGNFDWDATLGIAPHLISKTERATEGEIEWELVMCVITSGNIISVSNALAIGGFNEELFIDEVDFDFCYRGYENHLKQFRCQSGINLRHSVGNNKSIVVWGKRISTMNHSPLRKYYIIRNRLYSFKHFSHLNRKALFNVYIIGTIKDLIKIILIEDNKMEKLQYCFWGFWDFLHNRVGKKEF